jgi:hypothetical protein
MPLAVAYRTRAGRASLPAHCWVSIRLGIGFAITRQRYAALAA